jgi:hypothetical protein
MPAVKTVEELLKPRYKVIADYPESPFKIGRIYDYGEALPGPGLSSFEPYPHLFRKLEWWEDRKPEEIPKYYNYPAKGGIYKTQFLPQGGVVMLDFKPTETVSCRLEHCLPATEEQYLDYINSQPKT